METKQHVDPLKSIAAHKLLERGDALAQAVEYYLRRLHGHDPVAQVQAARYTIATAVCNWLDARKVAAEANADELEAALVLRAPAEPELHPDSHEAKGVR